MKKYFPIVALGLFLASCGGDKKQSLQRPDALPFPIIEVPTRDIVGQTTYPISLEGVVNNEVRAKISGYITKVVVDEGQQVRRGQLLFRLETQSLSEDAHAAKANIDAAQVGVDQLVPLVEQGIVSQVQLETAKAKLAQAKAAYNAIAANIAYANITSPVDGVVGKILYREGNLVSPTSPLPLTTVSQTNQVYAYFSMNEADYTNFLLETPGKNLTEKIAHFPDVEFKMANGNIYPHKGKITTVTAQVDPTTGTVSFRATFPNPDHLIAHGSSGTIIVPKEYKNAILVPEESTYEQQGLTYVFLVSDSNKVMAKVIGVEGRVGNVLVAEDGVAAGDKIIAKGAGQLRDGAKIIPQPMPFDSVAHYLKPVFQ